MRIVLAMPRHGSKCDFGAARAFLQPLTPGSPHKIIPVDPKGSILTSCFNVAWAAALDAWEAGQADAFAMVHSDVEAPSGWLSVMADKQIETGADVLAAMIPIKDDEGNTSTAIDNTGDPWLPRRITTTEMMALPETIGDADVGGELLLNTGLWICRLGPWATTPEDLVFSIRDKIRKENGKRRARTKPEDWEFSRAARARGCKLMATRAVRVMHWGDQAWPNWMAWGHEHDQHNGPYAKVE